MNEVDDELSPEDELRDLLETLVEAFDVDAQVVTSVGDEEVRGAIEGPGAQAFSDRRRRRASRPCSTSRSGSCCAARAACG